MTGTAAKRPDAVLIAGPTASGKSALALEFAQALDGVVVNADSMQVYDALTILTARPDADEMAGIEHRLYGHVAAERDYSVAAWLKDAAAALADIRASGKTAIFTGGTGLYFKALEEGLSPMPAIDQAIREHWRSVAQARPQDLHGALKARDPDAAAALNASDTQRLVRALEVFDATGRSILAWQQERRQGGALAGLDVGKWLISPDRGVLRERIGRRVDMMIEMGAVDEVKTLLARGLSPRLPVMRAIGVPQIAAFLRGEIERDEAIERIGIATRQYAKRQMTWFRNQTNSQWQVRPG
ncbi:MAG: tRNA (adenosine(37)-N6)-dimethylallyltransferase MiaA [Nitratireductor sp.]|nr:tRNA (adenosine(37)-N6)-dimethylallyltransferase MiaA [Nitratireductor sp.]